MEIEVTRDDAIRLNYECTLISMVLEEQKFKDIMKNYHLEKTDLPCINNRLETAKKYYLTQGNVFRAINNLTLDIKLYTLTRFNSGEFEKDLQTIKPEVEASLKQVVTAIEGSERN